MMLIAKIIQSQSLRRVVFCLFVPLFILLLSLSLISAATDFTFPQNNLVDLKITCLDANNTYCVASTTCNITINYPNNTAAVVNKLMSYNIAYYNYTTNATTALGTYSVLVVCFSGSSNNYKTFTYLITPNGSVISSAQSIIYFIFLIAALAIFGVCLYYAIKLPWSNSRDEEGNVISVNELKYVKLFLICMTYVVALLLFGLLRGITANYVPESTGVYGFFEWGYWLLLSFLYPLIVAGLIFALIMYLDDKKFRKALMRGFAIQ